MWEAVGDQKRRTNASLAEVILLGTCPSFRTCRGARRCSLQFRSGGVVCSSGAKGDFRNVLFSRVQGLAWALANSRHFFADA